MSRVLICGTGRMAAIRSSALRQAYPDVSIVVTARHRERADRLATTLGGDAIDLKDVDSTEVDAVFVTSATAHHRDDLTRVLGLGVPILIEKPLAATAAESADLAERAEKLGVPVIVGFQRRFDVGFKGLRDAVTSGEAGRIYLMRAASMDHTPGTAEFIASSAGIFRDLMVHDIESAMWIAGQRFTEVFVTGSSRVSDAYARSGDWDVATIVGTMTDGLSVTMQGLRHNPLGQDVRWEIFGSELAAASGLGSRTPVISLDEPGSTCVNPPTTFEDRFAEAFRSETRSFMNSVLHEEEFLGCSAREAALVSAVAEACEESRRTGSAVKVA